LEVLFLPSYSLKMGKYSADRFITMVMSPYNDIDSIDEILVQHTDEISLRELMLIVDSISDADLMRLHLPINAHVIGRALFANKFTFAEHAIDKCPTVLNDPLDIPGGSVHGYTYIIHIFINCIFFRGLTILEQCIKYGIDVNQRNSTGLTLLQMMIFRGYYDDDHSIIIIEIIKVLLKAGINVNACDQQKNTALYDCLHYTLVSNKLFTYEVCKLLIEYGAEINDKILHEAQHKYELYKYDILYTCLNKRTAKEIIDKMAYAKGYFTIIPRDLREYITLFNRDWRPS